MRSDVNRSGHACGNLPQRRRSLATLDFSRVTGARRRFVTR
jgi:hypothetical protein